MNANSPLLLAAVIYAACLPAAAHHSFAAVFDVNQSVTVTGEVSKVEWMNPHAWIYVDVVNEEGDKEAWAFELGSPNGLRRRGWSRDSVRPGDTISITGYRARDGSLRGNVVSIVLDDGTELDGMSSYKDRN